MAGGGPGKWYTAPPFRPSNSVNTYSTIGIASAVRASRLWWLLFIIAGATTPSSG
jgi:hypothetical protein